MAIAAVPEAKLLPNLGDRLRAFATRLVPPMSATGRAAAAGGPDIRSRLHPVFGHANVPLSQMIRLAV